MNNNEIIQRCRSANSLSSRLKRSAVSKSKVYEIFEFSSGKIKIFTPNKSHRENVYLDSAFLARKFKVAEHFLYFHICVFRYCLIQCNFMMLWTKHWILPQCVFYVIRSLRNVRWDFVAVFSFPGPVSLNVWTMGAIYLVYLFKPNLLFNDWTQSLSMLY